MPGGLLAADLQFEPNDKEKGTMSQKLKEMIRDMYLKTERHVDVFPPKPEKGEFAIPIGGLAKCICSPGCTKELPEPAYRIISKSEKGERWIIPDTPSNSLFVPLMRQLMGSTRFDLRVKMSVKQKVTKKPKEVVRQRRNSN